ncbi:TonB-dependent receptor [Niveibacterium umoris]|uniref:Iron complex outermembrane receptor protein n=1 Tax=Niveibacterium umoris TaxID=1193620 RepID=A0A840BB71_9RHOO|nr:TonB-dependent receptor [Niveibacterium umoris]MBB4010781.1 iron complex outermembrane receptor protein [Niveibacterium umoris]
MYFKRRPIATAVALVMMGASAAALAQEAPVAAEQQPAKAAKATTKGAEKDQTLNTIVVTGIRASLQKSLNAKRNAEAAVEVVTAEDIGKMPDKNVADSLQRLPGVTISSAGAGEGGFDEADRVSLRGTNPSLTQTTINGHMVSSGDWFVLNQVGTVGRSVSFSLLPSELVGQVIVRKSATADLVEGGVAGTVDIITRKPLDFKKRFSAEVSAGAVYADLPEKTDPQFSGLVSWKNEDNSFGVMLQAFSETRHLRRDGQEMLGYSKIDPASPMALSHPDLAGVYYPNAIGSALFEQERKRTGGLIDVQWKPFADLTLDLTGFTSQMDATNYNRNYLVWPSHIINGGKGQAPDPGYVVQNGTLTSATFSNQPGSQYAIVDNIYRPGANSETSFFNFDAKYRFSDTLTVKGKIGTSKGKGETPKQAVFEGDVFDTGAAYTLHGIGQPADSRLLQGNPSVFTGTKLDWIFGASPARTNDEENWFQFDGEYQVDMGPLTALKFGIRGAQHKRDAVWIAQGPLWSSDPFNNLPAWNGTTYPSNFGNSLGGNFIKNPWQLDPAILEAWGDAHSNRDPLEREYFPGEFSLKEYATAAYVMGQLEGKGWSGNLGLRFVRTDEKVTQNVGIDPSVCAPLKPCSAVPGAITTSAFGSFYRNDVSNAYNDVLPSLNLKFDLSKDLVARAALTRTMARPDFSALGGAISLDDTNHTGSGGNASLKPILSTNADLSIEWYFAPKALLSAGAFYMNLDNYVSYGVTKQSFLNIKTNQYEVYDVTSPTNSNGKVNGFEFAYQQPFGAGFGALANYTYANAKEKGGGPLVGASKNTYNLTGYFENDFLNARIAYNYRSEFYNGLDRSTAQYQAGVGTLAASFGYKFSDNFAVSLDGMNLNNPKLKYYANNEDQPTAFYVNGRQFYLNLRGKL